MQGSSPSLSPLLRSKDLFKMSSFWNKDNHVLFSSVHTEHASVVVSHIACLSLFRSFAFVYWGFVLVIKTGSDRVFFTVSYKTLMKTPASCCSKQQHSFRYSKAVFATELCLSASRFKIKSSTLIYMQPLKESADISTLFLSQFDQS